MTNSCGTKGGGCPMTLVLLGAILGLVVGLLTDNLWLWVGVGAIGGVILYLIRSMNSNGECCCTIEKPEDETSANEENE